MINSNRKEMKSIKMINSWIRNRKVKKSYNKKTMKNVKQKSANGTIPLHLNRIIALNLMKRVRKISVTTKMKKVKNHGI